MIDFLAKTKKLEYNLGCMICGIIIILFSLTMFFYLIPVWCSIGSGLSTLKWNSQTMPYVVAGINLALGIAITIQNWVRYRKSKRQGENKQEVSFSLIAIIVAVVGVLYVVLFGSVGYIPTTAIVMVLFYYLFGGKRWWEAAILAGVFTAGMVLFFYTYLKLAMPLIWFY